MSALWFAPHHARLSIRADALPCNRLLSRLQAAVLSIQALVISTSVTPKNFAGAAKPPPRPYQAKQATPAERPGSPAALISPAIALAESAVDRAEHVADLAAEDGHDCHNDN